VRRIENGSVEPYSPIGIDGSVPWLIWCRESEERTANRAVEQRRCRDWLLAFAKFLTNAKLRAPAMQGLSIVQELPFDIPWTMVIEDDSNRSASCATKAKECRRPRRNSSDSSRSHEP
jgi:hypothetical protein